jgi:hypothetical protein
MLKTDSVQGRTNEVLLLTYTLVLRAGQGGRACKTSQILKMVLGECTFTEAYCAGHGCLLITSTSCHAPAAHFAVNAHLFWSSLGTSHNLLYGSNTPYCFRYFHCPHDLTTYNSTCTFLWTLLRLGAPRTYWLELPIHITYGAMGYPTTVSLLEARCN